MLPSDAWLTQAARQRGHRAHDEGRALDEARTFPTVDFKPVAKLLVRMADLEQLQNVWLTSSEKAESKSLVAFTWTCCVPT